MGGGRAKGVLFGLLWLSAIWVHQDPENPNASSRLDLLHSMVRSRVLNIDAYHTNTTNKAQWNGHFYSDKPPGTVFMATPIFVILHCFLGDELETPSGWLASSWIACALVMGIAAAAAGVACFSWLSRWVSSRAAFVTTSGLFLGSPLLAYASSWFPHALCASGLFLALSLVDHPRGLNRPRTTRRWFLAGLLCGTAWTAEYSAGPVVAAVGLLALREHKGAVFAWGWMPPLALMGCYHWLCFDTPFTVPYRHAAHLTHMQSGLCGIHFPPLPRDLAHLLAGPTRGLFFWAPVLLMVGVGWGQLHLRNRFVFYLGYLVFLLQTILIAGYADLQAGHSFGPRLILCVLPWLAVPAALGAARHMPGAVGLVIAAWLANSAAAWTGIELPPQTAGPLWDTIPQRLLEGDVVCHFGQWLGWPWWISGAAYLGLQSILLVWIWKGTGGNIEGRTAEGAWPDK